MYIRIPRRTFLRGMMGGAALTVGLPLLDCFLNGNGTALASGAPLPVRFGTWYWGAGVTPSRFFPTRVGKDYEILAEIKPFATLKNKVSIMSGFNVYTDGRPQYPHATGAQMFRSGTAPYSAAVLPSASFDVVVADNIGTRSRFRTLDLSAMKGGFYNSNSGRGPGQMNPAEESVMAFYARVFGPEFRDPNSADHTPDPHVMARHSVLSAVADERKDLARFVGSADRARLDQYFTSVRQVENQLALQLEPPPPMAGCKIPERPAKYSPGVNIDTVLQNHELMARLVAMAVMCDQTRVVNMNFNNGVSSLARQGSTISHHQLTHEEPVDPKLGYQPEATKFVEDIMGAWATYLKIMDETPEGDGTLLDHMLIVAHSETCFAKVHTVESLPIMLAGGAGGRIHGGWHIDGKGDSVSRVALTAMQAVGLSLDRWGTGQNETAKPLTELLV